MGLKFGKGSVTILPGVKISLNKSGPSITIGKKGAKLKEIATAARTDMEAFFGIKVNLQCWVKVSSDWRNDERSLKKLGYSE